MKTNHKLALAALAGLVLGIAAATAIHAQQPKTAPAYIIAEVEVTDPGTFQKYAEKVPGTLEPFGGHFAARGGKIQAVEGDAPKRLTLIRFDSMQKALDWENSAAYEAIKPIRHSSAKSRVYLVEGIPAP